MVRFNGTPSNTNSMMKQFQRTQKQMEKQVKAFESKEFEATAGGGAVRATVIGGRGVSKVTLNKGTVDPDGVEMPKDLIKTAINETLHMVGAESRQMMDKLIGGLPF